MDAKSAEGIFLDPSLCRVLGMARVHGNSPSHLLELCHRNGLTLEALAQEVGVSPATLRSIEAGRRGTLITTALRIAEALGVEVEDIF